MGVGDIFSSQTSRFVCRRRAPLIFKTAVAVCPSVARNNMATCNGALVQIPNASEEDVPQGASSNRRQRAMPTKTCRVCGDKALAHNFDVISCESCKAFFRRNALRDKIKPCSYQGDCDITVDTRRSCCYCRLKKCLDCGMKADMILDTEELKARHEKLTNNRLKRLKIATDEQVDKRMASTGYDARDSAEVDTLTAADKAGSQGDSLTISTSVDREYGANQHETIQQTNTLAASQNERPSYSHLLKPFQHVSLDRLPSDPLMYWHLTEEERGLLGELTSAYENTILHHIPTFRPHIILGVLTPAFVLNGCRSFAHSVVTFFKRVRDFRSLTLEDQMAVLQDSATVHMVLRSSANFVVETDMWIKDTGYMPVSHYLQAMPAHASTVRMLADLSASLKTILRNDAAAYALLHCVAAFDSRSAGVRDRQLVNALGEKYNTLLKHHLEAQFTYLYAADYLDALRQLLPHLKTVGDRHKYALEEYVDSIEPLMAELFNFH